MLLNCASHCGTEFNNVFSLHALNFHIHLTLASTEGNPAKRHHVKKPLPSHHIPSESWTAKVTQAMNALESYILYDQLHLYRLAEPSQQNLVFTELLTLGTPTYGLFPAILFCTWYHLKALRKQDHSDSTNWENAVEKNEFTHSRNSCLSYIYQFPECAPAFIQTPLRL
ncbi:hypothetical protein P7K49_000163 [Saguinus oedipus]|uniref:Uncharacterized protein n=1 Tax=Saguinus oedipus TaxID=9490 RepID=A0ABQ9WEI2_SAGOE|nr:hypothetical protein P7K49_000163 [Saguinus oedipus]